MNKEAGQPDDVQSQTDEPARPRRWLRRFGFPKWTTRSLRLRDSEGQISLNSEDWKRQHDETSKTINNLVVVIVGVCLYCVLALGHPDKDLLATNAELKLPFADTPVSYPYFLIASPLLLSILALYLQMFVLYLSKLSTSDTREYPIASYKTLPFMFNLPFRISRYISNFLFYGFVPLMLAAFARKAYPRTDERPWLIGLTGLVSALLMVLELRRTYERGKIALFLVRAMFIYSCFLIFEAFYGTAPFWSERKLDLWGQDFSDQNLSGMFLVSADLRRADLTGTNLNCADLTGAHLENLRGPRSTFAFSCLLHSNFYNADLSGSNMKNAFLMSSDLRRANLAHAALTGAHFNKSNLSGANLTNTDLKDADFSGADLWDAVGLTQEQIDRASCFEYATLPRNLTYPKKVCPKEEISCGYGRWKIVSGSFSGSTWQGEILTGGPWQCD